MKIYFGRITPHVATGWLLVLAMMAAAPHVHAQNWQLVWADEFDGTAVDTTRWSFQIGDGCPDLCGWGNGEEQYYQPDNATVEDGVLRITAKRDTVDNRIYTSTRMRTLGKADWTYGRFEVRAKLTRTRGFWPAVWMLPSDDTYGGWAASGEIDILEVFGEDARTVHGTVHFGGESPQNTSAGGSWALPFGDFSRRFHDFAIEWVPGEIRWYVDDELYHTQNEWYTTEARFPAPFDQPFHLLLNVAVGGAGGTPDATSSFPQSMEVDYVRVYQSENEAPAVVLDAPANGATLMPGTDLVVRATPTDTDGLISRVLFYAGEALLAVDDTAPYEATISSVASGCYAVRARAIDNLGGEAWSGTSAITVGTCGQAPYRMMPASVPGRMQAEHFDLGGAGVGYQDSDDTNAGNDLGHTFRPDEAVDIDYALGSEQGFFVRDFEAGEWLAYQLAVPATDAFNIDLRTRSAAGATVSLLIDGMPVISGLEVPAATGDGFYTARAENVLLEGGVHTLRVQVDAGSLELDYVSLLAYVEPPAEGVFVVERFDDPAGAAWDYFGGVVGEVTLGGGTDPFMQATFSGTGGSGEAFYGVMWNNLPNTEQTPIPADPWFSMRMRHVSTATTVGSYAFEITLREDTDGNGWTNGAEDSHRLDMFFEAAAFNDEWIQVSAPLSAFTDLQAGGNGILEGALDEVVFVVSQVVGPDPSAVQVHLDDITISAGPLVTDVTDEVAHTLYLHPPYPNPTSGMTYLAYELDEPGYAAITLYDILGREVKQATLGFQPAGPQTYAFDLSRVASGVYFVRFEGGRQMQTRRIVVAR